MQQADLINPKLITWKNEVKTVFNGVVPYDKSCYAKGLLKIASVYKQGDKHYLQVLLKECRYKEMVITRKSLLSNDEENDRCALG